MGANERLQTLQVALEKRGVRDVKFFFNYAPDTALSTVAAEVADVLDAIQSGRVTAFTGLGDVFEPA